MNNNPGFEIAMLIREINSKLNFKITNELKTSGLTVPQITIVKLLSHHKRLTVTEISEKMSLTKATVSGILDRLEGMDIITRVRSEEDRRVVFVEFSDRGRKLAYEFKETINNCFEEIFKEVDKETLDKIINGLSNILGILDKSGIYTEENIHHY